MLRKKNKIIRLAVLLIYLSLNCSLQSQEYWTQVSSLFGMVTGFAVNGNNELYAVSNMGGVYKSTNLGLNWVQKNQGLNDWNVYNILITPSGDMYISTINMGVFRSTNQGNQWIQTTLQSYLKIRALTNDANGNIYAGTAGHGIFRSSDNGAVWININDPENIRSLAATSNGYVFAGTSDPNAIWRSTDEGLSFQQVTTANQYFTTITVRDDNIYAATSVFESDNRNNIKENNFFNDPLGFIMIYSGNLGDSWILTSSFSRSSYGITINQNNVLFVGKFDYVISSTDGGYNFTMLSTGIDTLSGRIISIACDSTGYVFIGQESGKVYRSTGSTIGISTISTTIPKEYKLYQNYPNPFNPTTKIRFSLPKYAFPLEGGQGGDKVALKIYDVLGREVTSLIPPLREGKEKYGTYEVEWNASNFSSGIYFCSLTAENFRETISMVLIK